MYICKRQKLPVTVDGSQRCAEFVYILAETSYFVGRSFQFLLSVLFVEPNIDDAENDE